MELGRDNSVVASCEGSICWQQVSVMPPEHVMHDDRLGPLGIFNFAQQY